MMGTATLTEALARLRGKAEVLGDLLQDGCVLWIGSGISRTCFEDVAKLLRRLLETLRVNAIGGDADNKQALTDICHRHGITLGPLHQSAAGWPDFDAATSRAVSHYSSILGTRVGSGYAMDLLDLSGLYGAIVPTDAEHNLLAALIAEGLCQQIVSANWDALIEDALEHVSLCEPVSVVVLGSELAGAVGPRLIKVHGCARRALNEPAKYTDALVGRSQQIDHWNQDPGTAAIRASLSTLLHARRPIFLGLSAQDVNLRSVFKQAAGELPTIWQARPSRVVVAGNSVEEFHENLLEAVFTQPVYSLHRHAICDEALVRLWAKPLLGALYLECLCAKFRTLTTLLDGSEWEPTFPALLSSALAAVEVGLAAQFDAVVDHDERWRQFASRVPSTIGRFVELLLRGRLDPDARYRALLPRQPTSLHEPEAHRWARLVLLLASLVLLAQRRAWRIELPVSRTSADGHMIMYIGSRTVRLFVAPDDSMISDYLRHSTVDANAAPDAVIFFLSGAPRRTRPPQRGRPTRTNLPIPLNRRRAHCVWLDQLFRDPVQRGDLVSALGGCL